MIERYFPRSVLIFLGIFAGAALLIGIVGALLRKDAAGSVVLSGLEAAILAFLGGLIARSFISFLLWLGRDSDNAGLLLGWGFFLWPGVFDTVARFFGKQYLTRPAVLLWIACSVGAFSGMMDGMWQTHNWVGIGSVAYTLDETWGLAGTTNGDLLHLVNFATGDHAVGETRTDAHRYNKGFAVKSGFAFTQGAVMSSNNNNAASALFAHEDTHIWQNRLAGPLYTLTYIGWMLLFLIPGLIVGIASGNGAGTGIQAWSYFSNPWEAMGYAVGESHGASARTAFGPLIWPDTAVIVVSIIFFLLALALAGWLVYRVWFRPASRPVLAVGY
jgi:hypothetical protein